MTEIFPYAPNWSQPVEARLSYKTDIFRSRSGKEQRRALRHTPRRTVSYTAMVLGDELTAFQRLLATKQNADFFLPDWTRSAVTDSIASGGTVFELRTPAPYWLAAGAKVFLIDGVTFATHTVLSVSDRTVTLTTGVSGAFGFGTLVRPAAIGLLGQIDTTNNTSTVATAAVTFDVTPASQPNSDNLFFAFMTGGKEVFAFPWNWGEAVATAYDWQVEKVDFQRGVTTRYYPVNFGTEVQKITLIRQSQEIDAVLRFIERQKGQRGEFWIPTGTSDMVILADIADGATSFSVAGADLYDQFGSHQTYKAVAIVLRDGRTVYRKVNTIGLSGSNSIVNLSNPVTFAIPTSLVAKISWMRPARMATDDQTIEYLTPSVAQLQMTTSTLPFANDVQDYADMDGAALWTMDNWGEGSEGIFDALDYLVNVAMPY